METDIKMSKLSFKEHILYMCLIILKDTLTERDTSPAIANHLLQKRILKLNVTCCLPMVVHHW